MAAVLKRYGRTFALRLKRRYGAVLPEDMIDDIVLAAIHRAWIHRTAFDPTRGNLEGWLWRIAARAAATAIRSPWYRQRLNECGSGGSSLDVDELPDNHAFAADSQKETGASLIVRIVISTLSEREQYILWADARSPGRTASSRQLALDVKIASSTVRRQRGEAKAKLAAELARLGWTPP